MVRVYPIIGIHDHKKRWCSGFPLMPLLTSDTSSCLFSYSFVHAFIHLFIHSGITVLGPKNITSAQTCPQSLVWFVWMEPSIGNSFQSSLSDSIVWPGLRNTDLRQGSQSGVTLSPRIFINVWRYFGFHNSEWVIGI